MKGAFLCVSEVPYVNKRKEIGRGVLVTPLVLSGDRAERPEDHTIHFCGEYPCDKDGHPIESIRNQSGSNPLMEGLTVDHMFSSKPSDGYPDYYEKITAYVRIIEHPAQAIDPSVSARTFNPIKDDDEGRGPFKYLDTNSSRAGIGAISEKLENVKVGIIGLGGTGSYVLDFVSKTPVKEIHLFDDDVLLQHNAYRMPGVSAFGILNEESSGEKITKVEHLCAKYSKIRSGIVPHREKVIGEAMETVLGMDFVFLCIDVGSVKKGVVEKLLENSIPCIDVGIGVNKVDTSLMGHIRTTVIDKEGKYLERISFEEERDDEYNRGIQIAEINALNAAHAVIRWKKVYGFYSDQINESQSVYDISMNKIKNEIET